MKNFFVVILPRFLLPILKLKHANRLIQSRMHKIDEGEYDGNINYVTNYKRITHNRILPYYERTVEVKKSLEDKAKLSTIGITISTSMIVGLGAIWLNLPIDPETSVWWFALIIGLCVATILHMNIAGILSLTVIGNKSTVYQLFPSDSSLKKNAQAKLLAVCTEQNANQNVIRHNYVFTSFLHMIHSLFCLSALFLVLIFFPKSNNTNKIDLLKVSKDLNVLVTRQEKAGKEQQDELNRLKIKVQELTNQINDMARESVE